MSHARLSALTLQSGCQLGAGADVPSGRSFIALLQAFRATGGTAPGEIAGPLLEEHQVGSAVSLAKRIYTGQVFGFEWRASLWIPMFQFDADDLALKAHAQRVRAQLPSQWSGWALVTWFAGPNGRLGGRHPVDMLDADLDAVMRAAQSLETVNAFALPPVRRPHEARAQM